MSRPLKGRSPVNIWKKIVPRDQTSALQSYGWPLSTSGPMCSGVPQKVTWQSLCALYRFAIPKSPILNSNWSRGRRWALVADGFLLFTNTLSSFMSRWMIFYFYKKARPLTIPRTMYWASDALKILFCVSGFFRERLSMKSVRLPWSHSSRKMYRLFCFSYARWKVTTFRCLGRCCNILISRSAPLVPVSITLHASKSSCSQKA